MNYLFIIIFVFIQLALLMLAFTIGQSGPIEPIFKPNTIGIIIIALSSLGATTYHAHSIRKHNRLLVKPHLVFTNEFNDTTKDGHHTLCLKVKNVGMGPALIDTFSMIFDSGKILDIETSFTELVKLVNRTTPANDKATCKTGFYESGQALDKGEEKVLVEVSIPQESRSFMQGRDIAIELSNKIDVNIDYRCHYNRKITLNKKENSLSG